MPTPPVATRTKSSLPCSSSRDRSPALATACNWVSSGGEPQKSKVHRVMRGLEKSGHVKKGRGDIYELTDRGSKSAKAAVQASAR